MKAFLILTCAGVAGLGLLSEQAAKVSTQLAKDVPAGSLELGVKALTGQLLDEQMRTLRVELHQVSPRIVDVAQPIPSLPPEPQRPVIAPEPPSLVILEAWGDDNGALFARKSDGLTYRLLDSGEWIALSEQPSIQPLQGDAVATLSSVQ